MSWRQKLLLPAAVLLLGACAAQPRREVPQQLLPMPQPIHALDRTEVAQPPPSDLWSQMRRGFAFARCDDDLVQHWASRYTRRPAVFERQVTRALPRLRYVADIILEAGLPAEFALLPWVESNFRPLPAHGKGAAGLWQIMPGTGRELGLRIDRHFDGRLHLDQSSRAVARMLWRDWKLLDDWRLADMAFNAGVYRVRRLASDLTELDLDQAIPALDVKPVTQDHLAKIQALACIVSHPDQHGVRLPDPASGAHLTLRHLPEALELPVAARLAGMKLDALREYNHAIRDPDAPVAILILPARTVAAFDDRYARLQQFQWQQWQRVRLAKPTSVLALSHQDAQRAQALALVNDVSGASTLRANSVLWLPVNLAAALPEDMRASLSGVPRRYAVRRGDSLWSIARRFHLGVGQIRHWNSLRGDLLHLGQILILEP